MTNDLETRVQAVNSSTLVPLVQQSLDSQSVELLDWNIQRIHGGTFGKVYRFRGSGRTQEGTLPWSLVLKVVHNAKPAPIDRTDPASVRYWKREPLAYQSGFMTDLPGNLMAPRCFDIVEPAADECWLWLEDVAEEKNATWSSDRYGLAARHLGQFNGEYGQYRPLPSGPWLGQNLLRAQAKEVRPGIEQLPRSLHHPMVQRFFPTDVAKDILQLWADQEMFLHAIERLPQTVCHRDAFRRNLFARQHPNGVEQTVAIDWEDVARGPVGEDLVSLIVLSLVTFEIELTGSQAFEAYLFECYLEGLHDSGWRGDPQVVRLGYTAACLRYGLGVVGILLNLALAENRYADHQKRTGHSVEETADRWAAVLRFVLDRMDEARQLMRNNEPYWFCLLR